MMIDKKKQDNLTKVLLQFIAGKHYQPLNQVELFKRLDISKDLYPTMTKIIKQLIEDGTLEIKNNKISHKQFDKTLSGSIHMHPRGFGFVLPDDKKAHPVDIFIPKHLVKGAVHGDRVLVSINPNSNWEKGPDGKVLEILERGKKTLTGIIKQLTDDGFFQIHCPLLGPTREVLLENSEKKKLEPGDRISMEIDEWGDDKEPTYCLFRKKIGNINDPSIDIKAACLEFDLKETFPKKVLEEAKAFGKTVTKKDQQGREDLTHMECFTIDPKTAKDFDDALSIKKGSNGRYHLSVHIADVAHYVKSGSKLDAQAKEQCNSTYFPGKCLPMLPEELSNGLCSLKQGVKRLAATVLMLFDKEGTLLDYEIKRTVIKSIKRFSYEEAKEIIDGKRKSPFKKSIEHMVELCLLLKKKRFERGGVDFALPEIVLRIDSKGMPQGYDIVEYDISHQLVEEFMLKANEVVAKHLSDKGQNLVFRIHEAPSPSDLEAFYALARLLGFHLPSSPTNEDIQKVFQAAKKTPYVHQLAVAFIRSMRLALYSPNNVGHYGLSLEYYCHFTSPIRRYPDLIAQRLLFDEAAVDGLEEIALHCSDRERFSFRAESSVLQLKKLRLLKRECEAEPEKTYEATVSRIKPFGLFFELQPLMVEGFIHISKLGNDFYEFDPRIGSLKGRMGKEKFTVGTKITVKLIFVNLINGELRFVLDRIDTVKKKRRKTKK